MAPVDAARSKLFLLLSGIGFLALIGLPLLLDPYEWAQWFRWPNVTEAPLTTYLGRCLGGVATAVSVMAIAGSRKPSDARILFQLIMVATVLQSVVHLWGVLDGSQPAIENIEVVLYAAMALLAYWCMPRVRLQL